MAKLKRIFICQSCGYNSLKWLGRCPSCEQWESFAEENIDTKPSNPASASNWEDLDTQSDQSEMERIKTGSIELDRVLGGGLIPDSFLLLGGDPGIGKSTLLLQLAKGIVSHYTDKKILYISGEESLSQIRSRAYRLNVKSLGRIFLASQTDLEQSIQFIKELKPHIVIMDSLQTFCSQKIGANPGSVSQVREIAHQLMLLSKNHKVCIFLVGHVTKEGFIAGPKMVEHMVDTVLYFEGESANTYRLLRTVKNRFGSARELGVFEMRADGLQEVPNPSSFFLSDRKQPLAGTAICTLLEGSRTLLAECQALVTESSQGIARRTAVGFDPIRIAMLAAILEKHLRLRLPDRDLFFNVAGGLKISDTACDLAAVVSIWSSFQEIPISEGFVFIGELGLTSEVRRVSHLDLRIEEAARLGFHTFMIPFSMADQISTTFKDKGLSFLPIQHINQLPHLL